MGRPKLRPVPSIAWVALWRDMPDAALPPHEVEKREEHIPRHDRGIEEKIGYTGEEAHFTVDRTTGIELRSKVVE